MGTLKKNLITPSRTLAFSFIVLIFIGSLLLTLPQTTVDGKGLRLLDAMFTATSAVCITGLVVVDTGTTFTGLGQLIILTLIQIGGLGVMTFTTFIAILLGKKVSYRERMYLQEALNSDSLQGIVKLARAVLIVTILIETVGTLILSVRFVPEMGWEKGLYYSVFHSISAFNNAGFDLFGNFSSLTGHVDDGMINLTMAGLIFLGGLGFAVLMEIYTLARERKSWRSLSLHAKCVLLMSGALIVGGTGLIFLFENGNALASFDWGNKWLAAFFQSVAPRSAGLNSLNLSELYPATLLVIIVLMYIGASPGSTGGGIKTTVFATLILSVVSTFKRSEEINFMGRCLPRSLIKKSIALVFVSSILILIVTIILLFSEKTDLLTALFEATSAFSTVGLSLGLTPALSDVGKITVMLAMFAGRVGPLTLVFALTQDQLNGSGGIRYPEGKIMIG